IFKLVGIQNFKALEIKHDLIGKLSLSNIKAIFTKYGLREDDYENIKFVTNSETFRSDEKSYDVSSNDSYTVFVFTADKDLKQRLFNIFQEHATNKSEESSNSSVKLTQEEPDKELTKSIKDSIIDVEPELTQEIINRMNSKTLELFADDDFKQLVRIYYNKPETIKTFLNYISHGNIVKVFIPSQNSEIDYTEKISLLKSLGISETDEIIKQSLVAFNGHLNLALRVLLCRQAIHY
ncbi:MAG: hypothetical protein EBZ58_10330, partial [Bacteroidetes bacterium]|nr:hypothetical protein [Bacteroidota bacterium]